MVIGTQRQAGRQAVRQADAETCLVAGRHRSGQFETVARHAVQGHAQVAAVLILAFHLSCHFAEQPRAFGQGIVAEQAERQA